MYLTNTRAHTHREHVDGADVKRAGTGRHEGDTKERRKGWAFSHFHKTKLIHKQDKHLPALFSLTIPALSMCLPSCSISNRASCTPTIESTCMHILYNVCTNVNLLVRAYKVCNSACVHRLSTQAFERLKEKGYTYLTTSHIEFECQ